MSRILPNFCKFSSYSEFDTTIAKSFLNHKGSATEFSRYLKSLQPNEIEGFSKSLGGQFGKAGVEYIRHRLQTDISKNELQLAGEHDRLRREGYDVGRKLNRGVGI